MHDRYSLSNKINYSYSLQFTMSVFELVWISVQQPSYKITVTQMSSVIMQLSVMGTTS